MLTVLNYLAAKNGNQIIIATHSQVMLENAIDNNLVQEGGSFRTTPTPTAKAVV